MINDWRANWHISTNGSTNPNFPFGFVQIANAATETASVGGYPVLRFRQTADYGYVPNDKMSNVFMATAVDLVDNGPDPIHPRYKQDVGERLALGALNLGYKKPVEYSAPHINTVTFANSVATISFVSEFTPISFNVVNKNGFEVCCNNANCGIDNLNSWIQITDFNVQQDRVILNVPANCASLQIVRYAWRQKPCEFKACALYSSRSNLPVAPFYFRL